MLTKLNNHLSSFKVVIPACMIMSASVLTYMITDNNKHMEKIKKKDIKNN
jgi:hypothetical protein